MSPHQPISHGPRSPTQSLLPDMDPPKPPLCPIIFFFLKLKVTTALMLTVLTPDLSL